MPTFSLDQFAALMDLPEDEVREWVTLGLLDPARTGELDDIDLVRVMAVRRYGALGYSPPQFASAIQNSEVEPYLGEYLYPKLPPLSTEEAAACTGMPADRLKALRTALGIRRRSFLELDLELVEMFKTIGGAGMPVEAGLEGARVMSDALRRLAESESRLVHVHLHERRIEEGVSEEQALREVAALEDAVVPLLDGLVRRIHHEFLLYAAVEDAYLHLVDSERASGRGTVETTIVFIDLASFTSLTETEGDAAAVALVTHLDALVRAIVVEHDGKVVKHIGDELMLAFRRAADAVRFAAALDETGRAQADLPALRVGMHAGPAIYAGGDYMGTTVNLASRVTAAASAGEILITDAVASAAGGVAPLESVGVRMLRGASEPLQLHRLARVEEQRDPVCGKVVTAPPAARLREGDVELWFCSSDCLRAHLARAA